MAQQESQSARTARSRPALLLNRKLDKNLLAYAAAASAAGVGALALATPAEARILYTPAHIVINSDYGLDLNHDGVTDFYFQQLSQGTRSGAYAYLHCVGAITGSDEVWGSHDENDSALREGVRIGPRGPFDAFNQLMAEVFTGSHSGFDAPWANGGKGVKNRYLGLRFVVKGKIHYGWARLNVKVTQPPSITATLTGYAYETIPNKPIIAGRTHGASEPVAGQGVPTVRGGTLGILAAGSGDTITEGVGR